MRKKESGLQRTIVNFRGRGAAQYLGMSVAWLRKARQDKAGPPYVRVGRTIIYRKADLDEFMERHLQLPMTASAPDTCRKRKH